MQPNKLLVMSYAMCIFTDKSEGLFLLSMNGEHTQPNHSDQLVVFQMQYE